MKKSIIAVFAACTAITAAAGLAGCDSCGDDEISGYDQIKNILAKSYSQIVLTVTDTFSDDFSLESVYTVSYGESDVTVEYSVESYNSLSLDASSASFKSVKEGSVTFKDGVPVQSSGDTSSFSLDLVTAGGMNFKEEYFSDVTLNSINFKANVTNPSGFFGSTVVGTDMKINAIYLDYMAEIIVTYTDSSGHNVKYEYNFTPNI